MKPKRHAELMNANKLTTATSDGTYNLFRHVLIIRLTT